MQRKTPPELRVAQTALRRRRGDQPDDMGDRSNPEWQQCKGAAALLAVLADCLPEADGGIEAIVVVETERALKDNDIPCARDLLNGSFGRINRAFRKQKRKVEHDRHGHH